MNRNTAVYLGSFSLSLLGNGIAAVLFPLLVLARTGDLLAAGILASINAGVAAVVGVLAGVVVDRFNRRTVSIVSDLLSSASIAALPVVDAIWDLDLSWFIVLSVIGTFGDTPGMTARETMLPRLVRLAGGKPAALDRLVGIREALAATLILIGPGLGGLLVLLWGVSSAVLLITAATSLAAALLTLALSPRAGEIEADSGAETTQATRGVRGVLQDLMLGWRFLLGNRLVLGVSLVSAVFAALMAGLQATILPAYFAEHRLPELSGIAIAAVALGSVIGAGLYAGSIGTTSRRRWFVFGMLGSVLGFSVLGALGAPWLVVVGSVVIGVTHAPMSAALGVATIEATPDRMRGRVLGAQHALMLAAPALTSAPLAAIAMTWGLPAAGLGVAAVMTVTAVIALTAPAFQTLDTIEREAQLTVED
ncbi:major facilitator superfamily MFS_1 [Leucobacter sp. 7(1)]|uniref:MFS transporter n=1 Tax=Leucobacter sp. 7(1) TaxID=1255613 RepID=UPI00097F6874|nr:MFS transporter [Leucobacter sp. 7(1)]SJN11934.1 major facilitator superfamily MFS_1 [Leucobacter sp. 7(1)]